MYGAAIQSVSALSRESVVELDLINIREKMPNGLLSATVIDSCQMQ